MADNKLKPCPFCGSDSIEVYTHYGESAGIQYGGYYPECTVCGCRLNYYDSKEEIRTNDYDRPQNSNTDRWDNEFKKQEFNFTF